MVENERDTIRSMLFKTEEKKKQKRTIVSKLIKSFSETSMNPSYKYIYILMNENQEGGQLMLRV